VILLENSTKLIKRRRSCGQFFKLTGSKSFISVQFRAIQLSSKRSVHGD
jgi:hypothetical protein